jgi:integrase
VGILGIKKQSSGTWAVHKHVSKRFPKRGEAEAFSILLDSAVAEALRKLVKQERPCRIREKLDKYLADCAAGLGRRSCDKQTLERHRKRLLMFDKIFHSKPIDAIPKSKVEAWMRRRSQENHHGKRIEPDTVNQDLTMLQAFARWCWKKGFAPADIPILTVGKLRVKGKIPGTNSRPPQAIEPHELLKIMDRIEAEREDVGLVLKGMFLFCLRPKAVCALRRRNLLLPFGNIPGCLESKALKGFHDRMLTILPESEQHAWATQCLDLARRSRSRNLERDEPLVVNVKSRNGRRNLGGWTTDTFDRTLAIICGKLEIKFKAYQVRHSAISFLQQNPAISPASVQSAAGHSRIETQNIYGKRRGQEAVPSFEALSDRVKQHRAVAAEDDSGGDVPGG